MGSQTFIPREHDVFSGLDVDKRSISVTFTDHDRFLKSLLLFEGIEFPPAPPGSQWSSRVKNKLRKLPCSGTVRFKLDQLLDNLEFNEKQILKTIREIRRYCQNDPELSGCMKYLMSLPGIGWIVASQLLTRTGDERLRSKLIQASWSAIRQDGELREFFRTVCRKHPRQIASRVAIVAVARKLSVRIAVVLMKQRPYEVREKVHSAPLTQEETSPQGTTRREPEPGEKNS